MFFYNYIDSHAFGCDESSADAGFHLNIHTLINHGFQYHGIGDYRRLCYGGRAAKVLTV